MFKDEQTVIGTGAFYLTLECGRDLTRRCIGDDCDPLLGSQSQTGANRIARTGNQLGIDRIRANPVRHRKGYDYTEFLFSPEHLLRREVGVSRRRTERLFLQSRLDSST